MYTIVQSESSDWYIIPVDKENEWEETVRFEYEGEEDWVMFIGDPSNVSFNEYKLY